MALIGEAGPEAVIPLSKLSGMLNTTFSAGAMSGGGGSGATATAVLSSGGIGAINVQDVGNNYNSLSNVVIQNQQSTSASANLVIHFSLRDIQISNPGSNFGPANTACNINISGGVLVPGGRQATAIPIITGNIITGYTITNNGNG
jgi:hypothetical protein